MNHEKSVTTKLTLFSVVLFLTACEQREHDQGADTRIDDQLTEQADSAKLADRESADNTVEATSGVYGSSDSQASTGTDLQSRRMTAMLPTERTFLRDNAISVEAVGGVIKSKDFHKIVQQLSLESAKDPLAQDVSDLQKQTLTERLTDIGHLDTFACGLTVCAGSIDIGNDVDGYQSFVTNSNSNPSNTYSYMDYLADAGNGNFEARFVMSVDPGVNSHSGRTNPSPRRP